MSDNNDNNQNYKGNVEPILPFGDAIERGIQNAIKEGAKRMFKKLVAVIQMMLSAGTEPFFRQGMGDRYFSRQSATNGYALWVFSGVLSCLAWMCVAWIQKENGSYRHLWFFKYLMPAISASVTLAILVLFRRFATENIIQMDECRTQGKTYHSRSSGALRFSPATTRKLKFLGFSLILIAPFTSIAFFISRAMSASLAAQEQARFYNRYLDMLDAQIEGQFLQDALLGKCSPELSCVYQPLPVTKNPQVREDIAAAVVGKRVRMVAQGPKTNAPSTTTIQPSKPIEPTQPSPSIAESQKTRELPTTSNSPKNAKSRSPKQWIVLSGIGLLIAGTFFAIGKKMQPAPKPAPAITASQLVEYLKTQPAKTKPIPPTTTSQTPKTESVAEANTNTTTPSLDTNREPRSFLGILEANTPPEESTNQPSVAPIPQDSEPKTATLTPVVTNTPTLADLLRKTPADEQIINQAKTNLQNQIAQLIKFKSDSDKKIAENSEKIKGMSFGKNRQALRDKNKAAGEIANEVAEAHKKILHQWQRMLPSLAATNAQQFLEQENVISQKMINQRAQSLSELDAINVAAVLKK